MPRTIGSRNGISTTPGYTAIGNVARVINGVYESQLKQNPNNSSSSYHDWIARMGSSAANAMRNIKTPKNTSYHKPSFNFLNTPTAAQQYMNWEKMMEGKNTAATQSAAQQMKNFANARANQNHMVTKGYTGNPTSATQQQKHAINASYYKPAKMTNATYDVSKTKTRTTQGAMKEPEYLDPYRYAYEQSGLANKFNSTYNGSQGNKKKYQEEDFQKFKKLMDNQHYTFENDLTNEHVRNLFAKANDSNAKLKSSYQQSNASNDAGAYQAQLARENERNRNAAKEKAINDAFAQISRQKRADAIRRKKAVIDDPDRGSRGTLANVIRDLKGDAKSLAKRIRRKIRR